jgi:hypothetical protein
MPPALPATNAASGIFGRASPWFPHAAIRDLPDARVSLVCGSKAAERQTCAANTARGRDARAVARHRCLRAGAHLGYDAAGVWVSDGCSAEFSVARPVAETFGRYSPTTGFTVADTDRGELSIRVWSYFRYLSRRFVDPTLPTRSATPGTFEDATYQMVSFDGGLKYKGLSFDAEYYWRRLDNFTTRGQGALPFADLRDTGFQLLASAMVVPRERRGWSSDGPAHPPTPSRSGSGRAAPCSQTPGALQSTSGSYRLPSRSTAARTPRASGAAGPVP